jgi:hypothetical protein
MPPVSPILYKGGRRELWPIASCVDNWIGAACVVVSRQEYQSTCFRLTGRSWPLCDVERGKYRHVTTDLCFVADNCRLSYLGRNGKQRLHLDTHLPVLVHTVGTEAAGRIGINFNHIWAIVYCYECRVMRQGIS